MNRSSLRRIIATAALVFSGQVLAQQQQTGTDEDPALRFPPSPVYIPPSEGNGGNSDESIGERPHTIIERVQRKFDERNRAVSGPYFSSNPEQPAGTISVDEARHPLSEKGERLIEKGQRYANAGDHRKAIDEFKHALNERSSAPYAHGMLGTEYLKINNLSAAIHHLLVATQSMPGVAANHSNLGYAYCLTGKRKAAENELRQAVRLDALAPQPRYLLGLLLLDANSPEAGQHLQLAQRVIKKARLALAIFHSRHGESDAAQNDLRAYFGPEWPEESANAEQWVVLAARLERPSVLFGMPGQNGPAAGGGQ